MERNKILLTAMHVKNTFFGRTIAGLVTEDLHATHVIIGHRVLKAVTIEEDCDTILTNAFTHFNWMDLGNDGYAGETVNTICEMNGTHASMSVGDVVMVQYHKEYAPCSDGCIRPVLTTRYFLCESVGWTELESEYDD